MTVVATPAQKGGVAKTTICLNLSVAAALDGNNVLLLDTDPQGSAMVWSTLRDRLQPHVEACDVAAVPKRLERAVEDGIDWVFVDTQPRSSAALSAMLRSVHFAIVPTKPNALDLSTLEASLALVNAAGIPGCIVLTMCSSRAPEIAEIRESLKGSALPVAAVTLGERRLYARATASGRAVMEVEPSSIAAEEIAALWKSVRKAMQ